MKLDKIKKVELGFFPTPLHKLERLTKHFSGPQIFIKRDDHTGLAIGGNKTRKLEFLFSDAINKNCDCVITGGAAQSNHCRQTAAAAALLGMECHLALRGEEEKEFLGNLLLDKLFGAKIHWSSEYRKGENIPMIAQELMKLGKKPYEIPYGGSNIVGALGYVDAAKEIAVQTKKMNLEFDYIFFASSSGGTHSGLIVGKYVYNLTAKIVGVQIDKGEAGEKPFNEHVLELSNSFCKEYDLEKSFSLDDVNLCTDFLENEYGVVSELERNAVKMLAEHEGILLDPVYTGRAFGAMLKLIEQKNFTSNDKILFIHTGGAPAIFSYSKDLVEP